MGKKIKKAKKVYKEAKKGWKQAQKIIHKIAKNRKNPILDEW